MADEPLVHSFAFNARRLETRTFNTLTTLHFVEKDGRFYCLDVNASANTLDGLKELVVSILKGITPDSVLPAAPLEKWAEIWTKPMVSRRILPNLRNPHGAGYIAVALVRL